MFCTSVICLKVFRSFLKTYLAIVSDYILVLLISLNIPKVVDSFLDRLLGRGQLWWFLKF